MSLAKYWFSFLSPCSGIYATSLQDNETGCDNHDCTFDLKLSQMQFQIDVIGHNVAPRTLAETSRVLNIVNALD